MSRPTVLSGALLAAFGFGPAAHATTWDVVFSGSGSSVARYHADGMRGTSRCGQPTLDYAESATFAWSYRWAHVRLAGGRVVADPRRATSSGSETIHWAQGPCNDQGARYACRFAIRPSKRAGDLIDEEFHGRRRLRLTATMVRRPRQCTGSSAFGTVPGPEPTVYHGFAKIARSLTPADLAGTRTVTHRVTLTRRVLGAPLHAACSGSHCLIWHCSATGRLPYRSRCSYTVGWRGTLRLIPHR